MHYFNDIARAQQRMAQLMKEAENERKLPIEPSITDQVLTTVGTWMINTGERLVRANQSSSDNKPLNLIETANG